MRLIGHSSLLAATDVSRVLGASNIAKLMTDLEKNTFGNNMIGPVGARIIADFFQKQPNCIETWYLASNCIDLVGLERLVRA